MIDQALPSIQTPAPAVANFRDQPAADDGGANGGKDFESFVSDTAAKSAKPQSKANDAKTGDRTAQDFADAAEPDATPAQTMPPEGARNSTLDMIESRLRLASLKQVQKTAVNAPEVAISTELLKQPAKAKQPTIDLDAAIKDKAEKPDAKSTPSEELGLLLGIAKARLKGADVDRDDEKGLETSTKVERELPDGQAVKTADNGEATVIAAKTDGIDDIAQAINVMLTPKSDKPDSGKLDPDKRDARKPDAIHASKADQIMGELGKDGVAAIPRDSAVYARVTNAEAKAAPVEDTVVRVVSADGKGRPVDIALSKATTEQSGDADKRSTVSKVETVTVIDARRYLGMGDGSNAASLATAIKGDPAWTEALSRAAPLDNRLSGDTITEVNTLKLQMNPENLGNMVASLKLKGEDLTVEVRVETIDAYRQLSADQDGIVKALQDQGFTIDQVTVQLSPSASADTGGDLDGQTRQNASTDDGRRETGDRDGNDRRQTNSDTRQGHDDTARNKTADSRADIARGSDIYL